MHLSDATLTFYHVRSCLSTTFLTFLKFLLFPFQELSTALAVELYYITSPPACQQLFGVKKISFEKKRRKRDLNPRAGIPDLHP